MTQSLNRWISGLEKLNAQRQSPDQTAFNQWQPYLARCGATANSGSWNLATVSTAAAWQLANRNGATLPWSALEMVATPLIHTWLRESHPLVADLPPPPPENDDDFHFLEQLLEGGKGRLRREHGAFYTPVPIVRYLVRRVDEMLKREFNLEDGLAATHSWRDVAGEFGDRNAWNVDRPFVTILDPAVGAGVFLCEVVRSIHTTLLRRWQKENRTTTDIQDRWQRYVSVDLLPRLFGVDLMPPALAVTHVNLCATLAQSGYRFDEATTLQLALGNSLDGPPASIDGISAVAKLEIQRLQMACWQPPITVLLGNPPFSGISRNQQAWIRRLLHGNDGVRADLADYFQAEGRPLGERKHWLHDDYVKFLRFAHWHIERAGCGVVGFVTNHGYLENPTFRGLREQLLRGFSRVSVVDLHGNRKKEERSPDGSIDENLFGVEQGVAIGLFRAPCTSDASKVEHGELWGVRQQKCNALEKNDVAWKTITPGPPFFLFTQADDPRCAHYDCGIPISEAFDTFSTAVVTARDPFVVAFDRQELMDRLRVFADRSVSDEEIRDRFFTTSRSTRYPPGDTRGWKLAEARQRMSELGDFESLITPCLYRPFDWRYLCWAPWMIDWPRQDVMQHLKSPDNVALIARRQMLPSQPCSFFWVTNAITIDGVIRSDNRGSESVFPLYQQQNHARRSNLSRPLISAIAESLAMDSVPTGAGDQIETFGPDDVLHYIYALFHSLRYRERYADALRRDFARILLPTPQTPWKKLIEYGEELVRLHTTRLPEPLTTTRSHEDTLRLGTRFPQFCDGKILRDHSDPLAKTTEETWTYRVGGYQVCRKWLRDRRDRPIAANVRHQYQHLVRAIERTREISTKIDQAICAGGDWASQFQKT